MWFRRKPPPEVQVDLRESGEARKRKRAESEWDEVREHVSALRQLRTENHFAERIREAMGVHE